MSISLNGTTGITTPQINAGNIVGEVGFFARNTAPEGWLKANGAAVSRSTYAGLFAEVGTTYGAGDGSTTFNLPDMRGEFPRGWDDGRAVDTGRAFGSAQTDLFKSHSHRFGADGNVGSTRVNPGSVWGWSGVAITQGHYVEYVGGNETRPRNVALLACIKF